MAYSSVTWVGSPASVFDETKLDQQDENTTIIRSRMRHSILSFDRPSGDGDFISGFIKEPEYQTLRYRFTFAASNSSPATITIVATVLGLSGDTTTLLHETGTTPNTFTGTITMSNLNTYDLNNPFSAVLIVSSSGGTFTKLNFYIE